MTLGEWIVYTVPKGIETTGFGLTEGGTLLVKAPNSSAAVKLTMDEAIKLRNALDSFIWKATK
mgnify:FL=1